MSLTSNVEPFIARWKASGASERANYQLFLTELCDLLGVEKHRPASEKVHEADYSLGWLEILEPLMALNKERAEEVHGLMRWLRPEYQNPQGCSKQI